MSQTINAEPILCEGIAHEQRTRRSPMGLLPDLRQQDPNQSMQGYSSVLFPAVLPKMQNRSPGRYYTTENDRKQMSQT